MLRFTPICVMAAALLLSAVGFSARAADAPAPAYASNFTEAADKAWSIRTLAHTPVGNRPLLGPFSNHSVALSLHNLPVHRSVEVTVELFVIGSWTGRAGRASWRVDVMGGPTLIDTDFAAPPSPSPADPASTLRQSYPDIVMQGSFAPGSGAVESNTLGYKVVANPAATPPQEVSADSVYRMTLAFPHRGGDLTLRFAGSGLPWDMLERWGLASVRVTLADQASALGAKEVYAAWDDLQSVDSGKAGAALAQLVRADDSAVPVLQNALIKPRDLETLRQSIADLSSDIPVVRNHAADLLAAQGGLVERPLRQAIDSGLPAESAARVEAVLARLRSTLPTPTQSLQQARSVALLELLGTPAAQGAIREIQSSSCWPRARREAAAALDRRARQQALDALTQAQVLARQGNQAALDGCIADAAMALRGSSLDRLSDDGQLQRELSAVTRISEALAQEASFKAALAKDPHDPARLQLMQLYLSDFSDLAAAQRLVDPAQEAALQAHLTAAAAPDSLSEAATLDLAAWYRTLAKDASPLGQRHVLRSARDLYAQALIPWPLSDPRVAEISKIIDEIDAQLTQADEAGQEWLDVTPLAPVTSKPRWSRSDTGEILVQSSAFATLTLPVVPPGGYELQISIKRTQGEQGIFVALPVGNTRADLNLAGWNNSLSGLECIDGQDASNNPTRTNGLWNKNRVYCLLARVLVRDKHASITVTIDGRPFLQWQGDPASLSTASAWWTADPHALAIGAHWSDVTFSAIRLRSLGAPAKVTTQLAP